ncbi:hypothetical protein [Iodobacter ciconiae]|uniref:hypothetical protein n=1 Tax=Iodobacter ciconiae TaxID=2496266 RepID=UPI001F440A44|nr:hypothetical protein [Iodobacter ciconiae]
MVQLFHRLQRIASFGRAFAVYRFIANLDNQFELAQQLMWQAVFKGFLMDQPHQGHIVLGAAKPFIDIKRGFNHQLNTSPSIKCTDSWVALDMCFCLLCALLQFGAGIPASQKREIRGG